MKLLLEVNRPRLKTSQRAFRQSAIAVWNFIPLTVRESGTIGTLKKQLKTYINMTAYNSTYACTPRDDWLTTYDVLQVPRTYDIFTIEICTILAFR